MANDFSVTFETITHESATHGDAEERGVVDEGLSFSEAVEELGHGEDGTEPNVCPDYAGARWITAYRVDENYHTGKTENRSLHIPERVTPSSRRRIVHYLINRR